MPDTTSPSSSTAPPATPAGSSASTSASTTSPSWPPAATAASSRTRWSRNVAGIETADYEIVEVGHDAEALTELFAGASVVCNTVGPFSQHGPAVVEACLATGVHYLDTTGEQDWLITCDEQYGADFAAAGLLLAPGVAQMYTTGEIAAEVAWSGPVSTPSTSRCSGAAARPSPRR